MNPVVEDDSEFLRSLGLLRIEELPRGNARVEGTPLVDVDIVGALADALGVSDDDTRVAAWIATARRSGSASIALGGARAVLERDASSGLLRGVVRPADHHAASVVHELASALTGIAGWARIASTAGRLPDRAREAVDALERTADDALDTARTLLTSLRSHVDAGEGCDVREIVEAALVPLRPLAEENDVRLRVRLGGSLVVRARAAEVRAIATNLVRNAIEAVAPGGEVVVTAEADGNRVVFTVVDDGVGIPTGTAETLFQPLRSGKPGGNGLGLALVREIVTAREGSVHADAGRSRGSRFVVELPLQVKAEEPVRSSRKSTVRQRAASRAPALRVLVVDDDEGLRTMVATALTLRGATVSTASGISEAMTESGPFDVALVDVQLRDGRGERLVRWLKQRNVASRIVVMTGGEATAPGAAALLRKPFSLDELDAALRSNDDARRSGAR